MRRFLAAAFFASVSVFVVQAQPPDLKYTFVKGKKYVYRNVFDQTHVQNNGASHDSFVHTVDMRIEVEDVDSTGSGTLLCTVLDQGYRRKDKGEGTTVRQLSDTLNMSLAASFHPLDEMPSQKSLTLMCIRSDVTPKFRVVLTPKGQYVSGDVLEKSESQKKHEEALKNPNVEAAPLNIDWTLKHEIETFFKPLPVMKARAFGETWSDTTFKTHEGKVYGGSGGSHFTYTREQRDFVYDVRTGLDSIPMLQMTEHLQKTLKSPSSASSEIMVFEWDGSMRTVFRPDGTYLGYHDVTTSVRTSLESEEAEAVVRGNAKFIVRVTLLSEE